MTTQRLIGLILVVVAAIAMVLVVLNVGFTVGRTSLILYPALVVALIGLVLVWSSRKR